MGVVADFEEYKYDQLCEVGKQQRAAWLGQREYF